MRRRESHGSNYHQTNSLLIQVMFLRVRRRNLHSTFCFLTWWVDGCWFVATCSIFSWYFSQFKVSRKLMIAVYYQSNCHLHGCTYFLSKKISGCSSWLFDSRFITWSDVLLDRILELHKKKVYMASIVLWAWNGPMFCPCCIWYNTWNAVIHSRIETLPSGRRKVQGGHTFGKRRRLLDVLPPKYPNSLLQ